MVILHNVASPLTRKKIWDVIFLRHKVVSEWRNFFPTKNKVDLEWYGYNAVPAFRSSSRPWHIRAALRPCLWRRSKIATDLLSRAEPQCFAPILPSPVEMPAISYLTTRIVCNTLLAYNMAHCFAWCRHRRRNCSCLLRHALPTVKAWTLLEGPLLLVLRLLFVKRRNPRLLSLSLNGQLVASSAISRHSWEAAVQRFVGRQIWQVYVEMILHLEDSFP